MPVQPQTSIPIPAPGYYGLNTQDSPVNMPTSFAAIADHCIIDNSGRIGSRSGLKAVTTTAPTTLGGYPAERVFEFIDIRGTSWVFVCGGGKIYLQNVSDGVLTLLTGYSGVVTDNSWQIVSLDDRCYFIQADKPILVFEPGVSTSALIVQVTTGSSWPPAVTGYPSCATSGFGRLWVGGFDNNKSLIVVSSLTTGAALNWTGTIDVSQFWPNGTDVITAIKVHNDFLIVFGQKSILAYSIPSVGPTEATLTDTVGGIGCVARDSVAVIGTDLIFLDSSGLRGLGRTIQEKSLPIGNLSINIKQDIQAAIAGSDPANIVAVFNPEQALYTLSFPDERFSYAFETKAELENGSYKATRWPNRALHCGVRTRAGNTYYGGMGGLYEYTGNFDSTWVDVGNPFVTTPIPTLPASVTYHSSSPQTYSVNFKYWTHPQGFGAPEKLKFLKQVDLTLSGGAGASLYLKWSFNYNPEASEIRLVQEGGVLYDYNEDDSDYGPPSLAEYSGGSEQIASRQLNVWGNGRVVSFGFEANLTLNHFSIQELNIQALLGRII